MRIDAQDLLRALLYFGTVALAMLAGQMAKADDDAWLYEEASLVESQPTFDIPHVNIPVLRRSVRAGTIITPEMVTHRNVAEAKVPAYTIQAEEGLIGHETTRSLREGAPVFTRHVRIPPDIRKGDVVALVVERPGLSLSVAGKSMEDGRVGESVRVMNENSKKILTGTVVDTTQVKIQ